MPKNSGNTKANKPKKNNKRTRKQKKNKKPVVAKESSYLATTNEAKEDFVVVEKDTAESKQKIEDDKNKIIVGRIYAEWCGFCKAMENDWVEMKNRLDSKKYLEVSIEEKMVPTRLDEINQIYLENSEDKLKVSGYPTIYRIENGNLTYYDGDRTQDEMYNWFVNKKGGKPVEKPQAEEPKKESKGWFSWW